MEGNSVLGCSLGCDPLCLDRRLLYHTQMIRIRSEKGNSTDVEITAEDGTLVHGVTKIHIHPIEGRGVPIRADFEFEHLPIDFKVEPYVTLDTLEMLAKQQGYGLVGLK